MISKKIEKYLKPNHTVLEWGSGESTLYFPQFVKKWISVEHNREWFIKTSSQHAISKYVFTKQRPWDDCHQDLGENYIYHGHNNSNVTIHLIEPEVSNEHFQDWKNITSHPYWNTEENKEWLKYTKAACPNGYEYTYQRFKQLEKYVCAPIAETKHNYDIIIVDGRARSMCAFMCKPILTDDGIVLFDDYFGREQWHSDVITEYEIIERISNLAVMKPK